MQTQIATQRASDANVVMAPVASLVDLVISLDSPEVEDAVIAAIRDGRTAESGGVFAAWWS